MFVPRWGVGAVRVNAVVAVFYLSGERKAWALMASVSHVTQALAHMIGDGFSAPAAAAAAPLPRCILCLLFSTRPFPPPLSLSRSEVQSVGRGSVKAVDEA